MQITANSFHKSIEVCDIEIQFLLAKVWAVKVLKEVHFCINIPEPHKGMSYQNAIPFDQAMGF